MDEEGLVRQARRYCESGHFGEAERLYRRVLSVAPGSVTALVDYGVVLQGMRRFEEALASFDKALAIRPDFAAALNNRGNTLRNLGRFEEALESFDKALAITPDRVLAWNNRGNVLRDLKRFEEALASFEKALAIKPDFAVALNNRGNALKDLKRFDEALSSYDKALAINSAYAEAFYNRGGVLREMKSFGEALRSYDKALAINPGYAEALHNRGGILRDLKRFEEALTSFDKALAIRPEDAEAWYGRGITLRDLGRFDEALASFDTTINIKPEHVAALHDRASLLWNQLGNYEAALRDLEKTVLLNPDRDYVYGDLLHLRMQSADWSDYEQVANLINPGVRAGKRIARPFMYQAISELPPELQICSTIYASDRYPPVPALWKQRHRSGVKIRVGYVSGEFREQATAFLAAGLYEAHDRHKFEIIAFDNGQDDNSPMRRRLIGAFDKFIDISGMPDGMAARQIADEEIDILVNLNGYFGQSCMGVFAGRPARLQVNYLGFPATLGAPYIDYILADRLVIPQNEFQYYTESVVWLPDTYQVNDSKRHIVEANPSRAENGLPESVFVFCNFNQSYKLTPAMFALWMRILRQVDGSVLWLLEGNAPFADNLRHEAARHGVAGERLVFAPVVPANQHLARLTIADLFLDTLPYNAHTTGSDALWAGLPVLTCYGKSFAGRVAASLLYAAGLPELVTQTLWDYKALALKLAREPELLQNFRRRLRENRTTCPLFDTDLFRRNIEAAYIKMWAIAERGERPKSFTV